MLSPSPDPCNVTLAAPDDSELTDRVPLTAPIEYDDVSVRLPRAIPLLRPTRRLPCMIPVTEHDTLVSDVHTLASQPLPPFRTSAVEANPLTLEPTIVRLPDPVTALLEARSTLSASRSNERT